MFICRFFVLYVFVVLLCSSGCAPGNSNEDNDSESGLDPRGTDGRDTDTEPKDTTGCGNGVMEPSEVCDDGNNNSGDGCSAMCDAVEAGFFCTAPGEKCVYTIECGDGQVSGSETCDDFNTVSQDGCSANCQLEPGWICLVAGKRCVAAKCGDGLVAGAEECDDGNTNAADGCSQTCRLEEGYHCATPGQPCKETICNNGIKEGREACDDGNDVVGDGCTPFCQKEPDCSSGACVSACGDGIILPGDNEECDDGNLLNHDGCSADCKVEPGFQCDNVEDELPDVLKVPVTYRDFIAVPVGDAKKHPDFETFSGDAITPGMVMNTLGANGNPIYTGICEEGKYSESDCPFEAQTTSKAQFNQWYTDVASVNKTVAAEMILERRSDNTYFFGSSDFFPMDGEGWVKSGEEEAVDGHNFGFTSELRYWFKYEGDEYLHFLGDDDVWVFINNRLAVDIGGLHNSQSVELALNEETAAKLGLEEGRIYETVLFHAERHTYNSRYELTLSGFTTIQSTCEAFCGDGIVAGNETCDDGVNDGSYGSCMPDCTRGDRCGDGVLQPSHEKCDDGVNLSVYSTTKTSGCAPGCVPGSYCGDSVLNSLFGESCDDGINEGGYGKCKSDCTLDVRCGDGVVQTEYGEDCEDGNLVNGDGCDSECHKEYAIME
ncbi:MAG: DUF4215 domain-containing protein [Deltaproteobacteria bacterium]|nr:DUF4215 domain-containing protein [Deltaproteobacteria bacterium]